jgi:hypothetical protein
MDFISIITIYVKVLTHNVNILMKRIKDVGIVILDMYLFLGIVLLARKIIYVPRVKMEYV